MSNQEVGVVKYQSPRFSFIASTHFRAHNFKEIIPERQPAYFTPRRGKKASEGAVLDNCHYIILYFFLNV